MKYITLILFFILTSCEKQVCKSCKIIIETNEKEAQYRCSGLANNYPNGYLLLSEKYLGTFCDDVIDETIRKGTYTSVTELCIFVDITTKTKVVCE